MPELEQKIAAWRKRLSAALPGREETVRELEAHLRDHIEVQGRHGVPAEVAFEQGAKRLGEPRVLAREFGRVSEPWYAARPVVVIYALTGLGYAAIMATMVWMLFHSYNANYNVLLVVHVLALAGGYLAMLSAGLIGLWTLMSGWRQPSGERERTTQCREIFRMTATASVLVPVGMVLGMFWAARHGSGAWSWAPVEVGALCILISTWLLLVVQLRVVRSEQVRAVLALLGATVVGTGWFAAGLTAIVPVNWLYAAAIATQGAIAVLHARSKRIHDPLRGMARE